ncbi:MAG: hypothetical protein JWO95_2048 [Verrucomicrobiales bacterium]|nr:hypothetical protein [Verrucomicrobiales bacterium]
MRSQLCPIIARRLPGNFLKHAIEVRQRLESDFIRDFADAQIWIEQQVLRLFDAHARDVVGEVQPGGLLEHLAKMERARVNRLGNLAEGQVFSLVFDDELFGARDRWRLGIVLLHQELIANQRDVLGENSQQLHNRIVLAWRNNLGVGVEALQLLGADVQTPFRHELGGARDLRLRRLPAQNLASLEEADQLLTLANRHGRINQANAAGRGVRLELRIFRKLLLGLEAGRASFALFSEQRTKTVLIAAAVIGQLPRFHRAKGDGKAGGFGEGAFVILVNFGSGE